jgi:hypothetical protein
LANNVFGEGHQVDSKGVPVEMGYGSPGNETANSVAAYEKWGRNDANYERVLAKKRQNLAECDARRAKAGR